MNTDFQNDLMSAETLTHCLAGRSYSYSWYVTVMPDQIHPSNEKAFSSQDVLPIQNGDGLCRQPAKQTGISRPTLSYQAPGSSATSQMLPSFITNPLPPAMVLLLYPRPHLRTLLGTQQVKIKHSWM